MDNQEMMRLINQGLANMKDNAPEWSMCHQAYGRLMSVMEQLTDYQKSPMVAVLRDDGFIEMKYESKS